MNKVKTFTIGTFIGLVAVFALGEFLFRSPAARQTLDDEQLVNVIVGFDPATRVDEQRPTVRLFVDDIEIGDPRKPHRPDSSPWNRIVHVAKGKKLTVLASQRFGTQLWCEIRLGEKRVDSDHWNGGPAAVDCHHLAG